MAENIRRMWASVCRMPERIRSLCASGYDFHFTEPGDFLDFSKGPVISQLNAEALIESPECDQNTYELPRDLHDSKCAPGCMFSHFLAKATV